MPTNLTISYSALLKVVVLLLLFTFFYVIRDILLIVFLSLVLAAAFEPWVSWFERHHLPRGFGIVALYLLFLFRPDCVLVP